MKKTIALYLFVIICSTIQGQLQEVWSDAVPTDYENLTHYPIMDILSDDELIVAGSNKVMKYDTLGNVVWTYELEGLMHYSGSVGNYNNHLEIDQGGNIYILNNLTLYSNLDTLMTAVQTVKLDSDGNELWSSQYEYNSFYPEDRGADLIYFENSIYITGRSVDSLSYCDVFLVKYDAIDGTEIWRTTFNDEDDDCDRGDVVLVDDFGNIYVGGKSDTSSNNEYLLLKYDANGILLWVSRHENSDFPMNDLFTDMVITIDGNIVLSGLKYSTVCFSSDGQLLWDYTPTSNLPINVSADRTYDIVPLDDGGIIMTGSHTDSGGPPYEHDILTVKISSNGDLVWENRYDVSDNLQYQTGYDLFMDDNNDVYVGGRATIDQDSGYNDNFTIIKLSGEDGVMIWDYVDYQNPDDDDVIRSIHVNSNGAIYATGTNFINGEKQFLTKKYFQLPISVFENDLGTEDFTISPNPITSGRILINSSHLDGTLVSIKIIDVNGKLVQRIDDYRIGQTFDFSGNDTGVYFVQIESNGAIYNQKLMIHQ